MPVDAYTDLDTLAASGAGVLQLEQGNVWSYPGAPHEDARVHNLAPPITYATDSRVQAALQAGAWVGVRQNSEGKITAVMKAPSDGSSIRVRTPAEFGTMTANLP